MGEVPDAHVLLVEDLVFAVVVFHVVVDEGVVDDGGLDGLGVLLDLLLVFEFVLHVWLHI